MLAFALLLIGALAGCVGLQGDDLVLDDGVTDIQPAEEILELSGSVQRGQTAVHEVEVGADAWAVDVVLSFAGNDLPGSTPAFSILSPDDEPIALNGPLAAQGHRVLPRMLLEEAGEGTYKLRLVGSALATGPVAYELQVRVLTLPTIPEPATLMARAPEEPQADRVVVAIVDTGINPYHDLYRYDGVAVPDAIDAAAEGMPAPLSLDLSLQDNQFVHDGIIADDAIWRALEPETLYRFEGTRVLGITFQGGSDGESFPLYKVLDFNGHGTHTSATALGAHANAEIVLVQTDGYNLVHAVEWTAQQPWIDIVSVSWGWPANIGGVMERSPDYDGPTMWEVSKAVTDSGKVYLQAAGNDPSLTYGDNAGAPWVVSVSGAEPSSKSRDVLPANGAIDFVSDFTVNVASHTSINGTTWTDGTSFSTPKTAGSFARALHMVRASSGHVGGIQDGLLVKTDGLQLDREGLYDAMGRAAIYWDTTAWDPSNPPSGDPLYDALATGTPMTPVGPYVQSGWGYVDGSVGEAAALHLLGEEDLPEKSADTLAYMDAQMQLRKALWT